MKKITPLFIVLILSLSATFAQDEKPTNSIEEFLVYKVKNGDLLGTSNGYLVSWFERDRAILRDIEPIVKRKGEHFLSVKTNYYSIEYQLYKNDNGNALIVLSETEKGIKVFKFVKYSKEINGFQPATFQDVCPKAEELVGKPENTKEILAKWRLTLHQNGFAKPGNKHPQIVWNGSNFEPTPELLAEAKTLVEQRENVSKKKKKK